MPSTIRQKLTRPKPRWPVRPDRIERDDSSRRVSPITPRPREGRLTEPIAGAQPWPRERVLMPLSSHWLTVTRVVLEWRKAGQPTLGREGLIDAVSPKADIRTIAISGGSGQVASRLDKAERPEPAITCCYAAGKWLVVDALRVTRDLV